MPPKNCFSLPLIATIGWYLAAAAFSSGSAGWSAAAQAATSKQYNDPEAILAPGNAPTPEIDGPIQAALNGDKLTLDQVYTYNKLAPSLDRISKSVIVDLIHRAHVKAKALAKQGKPLDAANIMSQALDMSHYMSCLLAKKLPWSNTVPYRWLASWKAPGVGLQLQDYIAPLNDYGFFLQTAGKNAEAIPIFRTVIAEDPTREVAYLNLADSLTRTGDKVNASQNYRLYKSLMQHESKTTLIPSRVDTLRQQALANGHDISADVVSYMDLVHDAIRKNWTPTKSDSSSEAVAEFHVDKDGHPQDIKIVNSAGNESADKAASDAIAKTVLPPLPADIKADQIIRFSFAYNAKQPARPKVYPIDRWIADVNLAPKATAVLPLVEALLMLHRFDDAQSELDLASKEDPGNTDLKAAQTQIGKARETAVNKASADNSSVQRVLNDSAIELAGGILPLPERFKNPASYAPVYHEHRKYHAVGWIAIANGAWELAIVDLSQAALTYPYCKDSWTGLASAYRGRAADRGENAEGMADLHKEDCIDPSHPLVEENMVKGLQKMKIDPTSFTERAAYADDLSKAGDMIGAIVEYRQALKLRQDEATLDKLAAIAAKMIAEIK